MSIWSEHKKYIEDNPHHYWFKRKLYGWGWTPATKEGWLIFFIFIALIVLNAFRLDITVHSKEEFLLPYILETFFLVFLLIVICFIKGEKPRWQWGVPKDK